MLNTFGNASSLSRAPSCDCAGKNITQLDLIANIEYERSVLSPITLFPKYHSEIRYLMAPMAGISDIVFRSLIREMGAQVVVSELISSEGLTRMGKKSHDLMAYSQQERPVGIQIFGGEVETLCNAAKIVEQHGADFVDINFGCPVKKVVCDGGGAAWLKNPVEFGRLLLALKKSISIPLTIKIRTGWDEASRNALELVRIAAECGVSWVAIHGRTRAQGYSGMADWDFIREIARQSPIPIIGNGDIILPKHATDRIKNGYAHAVMIGRGALKNPWIFQEILGQKNDDLYNFTKLVNRHIDLAIEMKGEQRAFLSLKKFLAWYATGYYGASQFRQKIFSTSDVVELRKISLDFFAGIDHTPKKDDGQPFLMGGHG